MTVQSLKIACLVASGIATFLGGCASGPQYTVQFNQSIAGLITKDQNCSVRLPEEEKVFYQGVVSFDQAGAPSESVLYPADNVVVALATVITHGILVETFKNSKKNKLQKAADNVLLPYQAVLSNYNHKELMQRGLEKMSMGGSKKLVKYSEKPMGDWVIESTPVFSITQDQSAIILDNVIAIYVPDAQAAAAYQNIVRVVSQAKDGTDLSSFWTANQGKMLKEESASLFAQSLDIALNDIAIGLTKADNAFKTFRYLEGNTEKMERGQLISERCDRMVIKTLRGWLMSIPVRRDAAVTHTADQCGSAPSSQMTE